MYYNSYDNYECSSYDLYDLFPVVYDKIDMGETTMYIYWSWED